MRSGSRCPAFCGEIPLMKLGFLDDDGGYFYCITYSFAFAACFAACFANCNTVGEVVFFSDFECAFLIPFEVDHIEHLTFIFLEIVCQENEASPFGGSGPQGR